MRKRIWLAIGAFVALTDSSAASAQSCLPDHHEAVYHGKSAKLRDYLCKVGDGGIVRVTFLRLDERMAGGLLMGEPTYELRRLIGNLELIENEVSAEARKLFQDFGSSSIEPLAAEENPESFHHNLKVEAPPLKGAGSRSEKIDAVTKPETQKIWYLTDQDTISGGGSIFLPEADKTFQTTDGWPEGFNLYYNCPTDGPPSPISCVKMWRYMKIEELADITRDTEAWEKEIQDQIERDSAAAPETGVATDDAALELPDDPAFAYNSANGRPDYKKHFPMFRHLAKQGWPEHFAVITGDNEGCGGEVVFTYFPRPLLTDVMVIENLSVKPIELSDVVGAKAKTTAFRSPADSTALKTEPATPMAIGKRTIVPNGRVGIALRMQFDNGIGQLVGSGGEGTWDPPAVANAFWKKIKAKPAGSMVREDFQSYESTGDVVRKMRKRRDSYVAPLLPKRAQYVYGPEVQPLGLVIDGQNVTFEGNSANFLQFVASSEGGSCPFLYSWDAAHNDWRSHGKVIDEAREASREMTEVVPVPAGVLRFKLAEEEPEVSYIDAIALRLTLSDGRQMSLAPMQDSLAAADKRYFTILAYRRVEFAFDLPFGVASNEIVKSELAITGYYRRYSTIMAASGVR